jgi:two-component system NtrC family response regulator
VIERIGGRQPIQVEVRIVCATNQDLQVKMQRGEFRDDVFYRLNEVSLRVPPLRERAGDTALLANVFLNRFAADFGKKMKGFSGAAMSAITGFDWPGNVRELENRIKRSVVMCEGRIIEPADLELAPETKGLLDLDIRAARTRAEREVIQLALSQGNGVIAAAAKLLGVSRPTLYGLLQEHGIGPALELAREQEDSPSSSEKPIG